MIAIGRTVWVIAEGYIPPDDDSAKPPEFVSHETACILNAGDEAAKVEIMLYFQDKEPVGPYTLTIPARRTHHMRFNDLKTPVPVPRGIEYSSVITSSVPIVVQHTRLDSRRNDIALLSTTAFPAT
jgi:hypothetical protein